MVFPDRCSNCHWSGQAQGNHKNNGAWHHCYKYRKDVKYSDSCHLYMRKQYIPPGVFTKNKEKKESMTETTDAATGLLARYFDTRKTDCIEINTERYEIGKKNTTHATWYNSNFFDFFPTNKYDLIVSNPPYGDAVKSDRFRFTPIEFIEKSASVLKDDGLIVFLLESDYFRSINRYERFKNAGIFLTRKIDIIGRLKFIVNGKKATASASRYHSIFEFSKIQTIPILENIKL